MDRSVGDIDKYEHEERGVFYTHTSIPGPGVDPELLQESFSVCCSCKDVCAAQCACIQTAGGLSVTYVNSRLHNDIKSSKSFILECSDLCECSKTCGNRLVQFGPRHHLSVFKTDLKGSGLRTDAFIASGSFICEYAGELIGREEAKKRALYDSVNYIFVLKEHYADSITETIVDPTCIGNIGRYINHSCQPNAVIIPVRVDSPIPRLAVFSIRDIQINEEITYDYANGGSGIGKTKCYCKAINCRGFLPFDKDLLS